MAPVEKKYGVARYGFPAMLGMNEALGACENQAIAASSYIKALFKNSAIPSGVFSIEEAREKIDVTSLADAVPTFIYQKKTVQDGSIIEPHVTLSPQEIAAFQAAWSNMNTQQVYIATEDGKWKNISDDVAEVTLRTESPPEPPVEKVRRVRARD